MVRSKKKKEIYKIKRLADVQTGFKKKEKKKSSTHYVRHNGKQDL